MRSSEWSRIMTTPDTYPCTVCFLALPTCNNSFLASSLDRLSMSLRPPTFNHEAAQQPIAKNGFWRDRASTKIGPHSPVMSYTLSLMMIHALCRELCSATSCKPRQKQKKKEKQQPAATKASIKYNPRVYNRTVRKGAVCAHRRFVSGLAKAHILYHIIPAQ